MPPQSRVPAPIARNPDEMLIGLDAALDGMGGDLDDYDSAQRDEIAAVTDTPTAGLLFDRR